MTTEATIAPDVQGPAFDRLPAIFRDCVDPEHRRYSVGLPFVRGEWVYATDGCIVVRTRATPEVVALLPPGDRRVPEAEAIFDNATEYAPEPVEFAVEQPAKCGTCDGKRRLPERECDECDGEGEMTCLHCGYAHACPDCGGKGVLPAGRCRDCSGTGFDVDDDASGHARAVAFANGTTLGQRYAWLLERHNAQVFLPVRPQTLRVSDPVKFTAPGDVVGFVMPLDPKRLRP